MSTDLRDLLDERIGSVVAPPGDLGRARREGIRIRRRRRATLATGGAVVALAVVLGGTPLVRSSPGPDGEGRGVEPLGRLDFSQGLRAYADPFGEVHLGGRAFPGDRLQMLDTDAAATPYGILHYVDGVPRLLGEDGVTRALEPEAESSGFLPTAKADSVRPLVAYGATIAGRRLLVVRDLEVDEQLATLDVTDRRKVVVDALDGGVVMVRDSAGTTAWDTATGQEQRIARSETRVADLRNGVLLYDGPPPDGPAAASYRLVRGAIDAQLTFDGGHVLSWSSRLEPTVPGGDPVVLERRDAGFFAVDTDGSVLAAEIQPSGGALVFDCEVPSGACTKLGALTTEGGDPAFIGVDM